MNMRTCCQFASVAEIPQKGLCCAAWFTAERLGVASLNSPMEV